MNDAPHVCPLCHGDGNRRYGKFVNNEETCRAYGGKGIVWPPNAYYPAPPPWVPVPAIPSIPNPWYPATPWTPYRITITSTSDSGQRLDNTFGWNAIDG